MRALAAAIGFRWPVLAVGLLWARASRMRQLPPVMIVGGTILALYLLVAITGPLWIPFGSSQIGTGPPFAGASWQHFFGTDTLGRDVFSRVVIGTRTELALTLAGTILGCGVGAVVGMTSVYFGRWLDAVLMRVVDGVISIPALILALVMISAAGPARTGDAYFLILIVAFIYAPRMARMARAASFEVMTREFVTLARARGERPWSIMGRELLPNITGTLFVEFAVRLGNAPMVIASLGFLGLGMRPPTPEWGLMISENRSALLTVPIIVLAPAATLALLVIGINLFSDGLAQVFGQTVRPVGRGWRP